MVKLREISCSDVLIFRLFKSVNIGLHKLIDIVKELSDGTTTK